MVLGVVDFVLMRRYARIDPPGPVRPEPQVRTRGAHMTLEILWFCAIAVLWGGYFVLEGFDFGVGQLLPFLARDEDERSALLGTIGPHWDGNEVWLVIAAGATFAAFPAWYATMFSAFYLVLLLILVLLIVRVLSFEWRERDEGARWRGAWRWANTVSSVGAPFLWGVALASLLYGIPLDGNGDFTGNVLDLFNALHGRGGRRGRAAVRAPRRDVPLAAGGGRAAGARGHRRAPAQPAGGARRGRVPRLDRRGRRRSQRARPARAARAGGDRRRRARCSAWCSRAAARSGWAFGDDRGGVAVHRGDAVHGALRPRARVGAEPGEQPHDRRRGDRRTTRSA